MQFVAVFIFHMGKTRRQVKNDLRCLRQIIQDCVLPSNQIISVLISWYLKHRSSFVCSFELILYVPVNSNGHVGTLPPSYGTFTQHYDVMTLKMCFIKITTQLSQKVLYVLYGLTLPLFLGRLRHERLTSNQMVIQ